MSKIISIGTAVPAHRHNQDEIMIFMQRIFAMNDVDRRKLKFLYHQSGIESRYSVIPDYSRDAHEWKFYPQTENLEPFPSLELRMNWFDKYAPPLSVDAIRKCVDGFIGMKDITHLITVSCTGMSAPGLDLRIMELLDLPRDIYRTSVNFMGCYAAIHALKMADSICKSENAKVIIVCTELCSLHFQREPTIDTISSSLLFGDGAAAMLITPDSDKQKGLHLDGFYSEIITKGKRDMAWELSSSGFLMTLSGYVPDLIEEDFDPLLGRALSKLGINKDKISHWCIHPGGKRILEAIRRSVQIEDMDLEACYKVLKNYGNMSSPTIIFVLQEMWKQLMATDDAQVFGAAFGPGLTMETFIASPHA